jgi:hypothetical protein
MRWWDVDKDIEKQLIFLVTRKEDAFPKLLGMEDLSG